MTIYAPPPAPPPPKKRKFGCCGCGCLILGLLLFLFVGLVAGLGYLGYTNMLAFTSTSPAAIPFFDGSDDLYNTANTKLTAFNHDVLNHQAATIHLSGDEINTLIARDADLRKKNIHLFVTFSDTQARLQSSIPTEALTENLVKKRYLNADISFGVDFDSATKALLLELLAAQIGQTDLPKDNLPMVQTEINPALNAVLRNDPTMKLLLDQAKSIEIKDNELVIVTE